MSGNFAPYSTVQDHLATASTPGDRFLGHLPACYPPLWAVPVSWALGSSSLFHSLAICRLIDYFDPLRN